MSPHDARNCRVETSVLLVDDVEHDPVEQRVVMDGSGVSGATTQGLSIGIAGVPKIRLVNEGERNQFDRIYLDLSGADTIAATNLNLASAPEPKRDRDLARENAFSQIPAELHGGMLANSLTEAIPRAHTHAPVHSASLCPLMPLPGGVPRY